LRLRLAGWLLRPARLLRDGPLRRLPAADGLGATLPGWLAWLARRAGALPCRQDGEVVVRDRVLKLFPEETLVDEHIDSRRVGVGELALEQPYGVDILLAAEDELFFPLALDLLFPHRHDDSHHDGHDAHRYQQGRHRIAALVIARLTLTS
jgi:hypothetical protein